METILTNVVAFVNDILWNKYLVLLFLLLGSGVFFTVRTNFVQVRKFGEGMRLVFGNLTLNGKAAGKDGMSSFQALATAIAAQVGTGNIAGCASALVSGGPGAVFWMWLWRIPFRRVPKVQGSLLLNLSGKRTEWACRNLTNFLSIFPPEHDAFGVFYCRKMKKEVIEKWKRF